jgi:hypothetical protein
LVSIVLVVSEKKLPWNDHWKVLYKFYVFYADRKSKMAAIEISIFSNGGHLGYRTALTDTILKGDHRRIISAKLQIRKKGG